MHHLAGEYECKLDEKGRLKLPLQLVRQLSPKGAINFTINRGFEKCLTLYPDQVWEQVVQGFDRLVYFNQKERKFLRYFFGGATPVSTDSVDRVNLPKPLTEWAGINREVVLVSMRDRVEIWSKELYRKMREDEMNEDAASDLAEEVFARKINAEEESA
jgi:MraZ protein